AGSFKNTACTASTEVTPVVCGDATPTATQNPALSILKTANPTTYTAKDQEIGRASSRKNTGNTTVHNVSITEPLVTLTCTPTVPVTSLAPQGQISCTGTHTITQADLDAGSFKNTACTASTEVTPAVCGDATPTATQNPALSILKTANPTTYTAKDQVITFTVTATNTGNTTLHNVSVTDPLVDRKSTRTNSSNT